MERFSAVFDIVDEPAWLKCVALRFCLVAKSLFDDGKCPAETTESKQQTGGGSSKQRSVSGQYLLQLQQPAWQAMVPMLRSRLLSRLRFLLRKLAAVMHHLRHRAPHLRLQAN